MAFRAAKLLLASLCAAEASKEINEALATDEVCSSGQCSLELLQVHGCAGKEATSDCSDTCTQTVWKACMEKKAAYDRTPWCRKELYQCLDHCSSKSCSRQSGSCWGVCAEMHTECEKKDWFMMSPCEDRLQTCMKNCRY